MKNITLLTFTAIGLMLSLASASRSATITQMVTFDTVPDDSINHIYDKFNPALGILNSVRWELSGTALGGTLAVDNDGVAGGSVTLETGVHGSLSGDVSILEAVVLLEWAGLDFTTSATETLAADGAYPLPETSIGPISGVPDGSGFDFDLPSTGGSTDFFSLSLVSEAETGMLEIDSSVWGQYTGAGGTFSMDLDLSNVLKITGLGGLQIGFIPSDIAGDLELIYEYTPVPEPSTYALIIAGIGLMSLRHRCRK